MELRPHFHRLKSPIRGLSIIKPSPRLNLLCVYKLPHCHLLTTILMKYSKAWILQCEGDNLNSYRVLSGRFCKQTYILFISMEVFPQLKHSQGDDSLKGVHTNHPP